MKAVGVKILKAKLSEFLRLVKSGETILVTERDEVVAELRPAHHQLRGDLSLHEALEAMAEKGEATLATGSFKDWKGLKTKLPLKNLSSRKLLDELRREGS